MKTILKISVLSMVMLACDHQDHITPSPNNETTVSTIAYEAFPEGYGYLKDTAALAKAVVDGNKAYVRKHAWQLWAGIMQPAEAIDWPVWYTWENTFGAFAVEASTDEVALKFRHQSLIQQNIEHAKGPIMDTLNNLWPVYPIPQPVIEAYKDSGVFTDSNTGIKVGKHFLFNGDIMVPTESLSEAAFDWIRGGQLYTQSKLNQLYDSGQHQINAPQAHIVTKHMYWPVPASGVSALPVWHEDYYPTDFRGYAGYETWSDIIGIDPSGAMVDSFADVSFLYGVYENKLHPDTPIETKTTHARVHGLDEFYYHRVTQSDWDSFDAADQAILNAASYWAHNKPFGVGDYLITIAMHVNTKEVPTWALQSVWWSNIPNLGKYAEGRPDLPNAVGPWDHYLMVDAYGIIDPQTNKLPIAMNPYIELVIHPIATNCNNCHSRAGWPTGNQVGMASYQNPDCVDLLEKLSPQSPCLSNYLLTDFQWIIPDHAIK